MGDLIWSPMDQWGNSGHSTMGNVHPNVIGPREIWFDLPGANEVAGDTEPWVLCPYYLTGL